MTTQLSFHGRVSHLISMYLVYEWCHWCCNKVHSLFWPAIFSWMHLNRFEHIATHIYLFYSFPPQYKIWKKQKMARSTHPQGLPFLPHPSSPFNTVVVPTPVLSRTSSVHPDALYPGRDQPSPTSVAYHPTYFGVTELTGQQCLPCDDYRDDDVVSPRSFLSPRKNQYKGSSSPIPKTKRNKKSSSPTPAKNAKYKTEWCTKWKMFGFCQFGDDCHFIHYEWERRSTGVMPSLPCFTAVSTGSW